MFFPDNMQTREKSFTASTDAIKKRGDGVIFTIFFLKNHISTLMSD